MSLSSSAQPTRWLLIAIIVLYLTLGALYAFFTPNWQAPDEPAHYNYVKYLAEQHRFPILKMGDYPGAYRSHIVSSGFPPEMSIDPLRYEFHQPPLYYLLATPVYQFWAGNLLPLRLFSVALGALLLLAVNWAVTELVPEHPCVALGATAFVAILPMHLAMTAAINNDILSELVHAIILLLTIRYLKADKDSNPDPKVSMFSGTPPGPKLSPAHAGSQSGARARITVRAEQKAVILGAESRLLVLLGLATGLALITKSSNYIAVPLIVLTIAARQLWPKQRAFSFVGSLKAFALYLLPATALALPWWLRNMAIYGGFDFLGLGRHKYVVTGQLTQPEYIAAYGIAAWIREMCITPFRSFWGQFGWMGVLMDQRIYQALAILSGLALIGFVSWLVRGWRNRTEYADWQKASCLLLTLSGIFTLASFFWYNIFQFVQPQGRYLFLALVPISLAVALGWREVLRREHALSVAALLLISAVGLKLIDLLPTWPLLMLVLAAGAFVVRRFLPDRWSPFIQACPYLLLIPLNLAALFLFIIPQLAL